LDQGANFCHRCGAQVTAEMVATRHQAFKVTGEPTVVICNGAPVNVEINAGTPADGEVAVDFDSGTKEDFDLVVSQDANRIDVRCLLLNNWSWPSHFLVGIGNSTIKVTVPTASILDVESRYGAVEVKGVNGSIRVDSSAGAVLLKDCRGNLRVEDRTGTINLDDVEGTVLAETRTGSIKLSGCLSGVENRLRTRTGGVEVYLKGIPNLKVEAYARHGSITVGSDVQDGHYDRGFYSGKLGDGVGRLAIETRTGDVTVQSRQS